MPRAKAPSSGRSSAVSRHDRQGRLGTAVTCPTIRIHPAIIAQAAATAEVMMPGRFFLGVGTDENLNEHILGDRWPEIEVRLEMLEEAIDVMRTLWSGGYQSYYGNYYVVENARIYTLPDSPPEIIVAASGPRSGELAASVGDGLMKHLSECGSRRQFDEQGSGNRPKYLQLKVCYGDDEAKARSLAHKLWPTVAMPGQIGETATPLLFENIAELVTEDQVAEMIVCGADEQRHWRTSSRPSTRGFDHIAIARSDEQEQASASMRNESCRISGSVVGSRRAGQYGQMVENFRSDFERPCCKASSLC
ncbi:MAG: TIGR03557 family F420-dependent LLM class oxidoreductase [Thermomicrobiales bacterium]